MKSWKPYILIVFILLIGWTIILNRSARNKLELNRLESSCETLREARSDSLVNYVGDYENFHAMNVDKITNDY